MLTAEQVMFDALTQYAQKRQEFFEMISVPGFKKPDGEEPTQEEIDDAEDMAELCHALAGRAKEKCESPIILMNGKH